MRLMQTLSYNVTESILLWILIRINVQLDIFHPLARKIILTSLALTQFCLN